ncbi:MAG: hypothetical protein J5654_05245 [Victivallales bacterium]|nr:hypothetical protein [Victivallales bacterium]
MPKIREWCSGKIVGGIRPDFLTRRTIVSFHHNHVSIKQGELQETGVLEVQGLRSLLP